MDTLTSYVSSTISLTFTRILNFLTTAFTTAMLFVTSSTVCTINRILGVPFLFQAMLFICSIFSLGVLYYLARGSLYLAKVINVGHKTLSANNNPTSTTTTTTTTTIHVAAYQDDTTDDTMGSDAGSNNTSLTSASTAPAASAHVTKNIYHHYHGTVNFVQVGADVAGDFGERIGRAIGGDGGRGRVMESIEYDAGESETEEEEESEGEDEEDVGRYE